MKAGDFEREVEARLKGSKQIVVMAVGDELNPRDCVGILAGRRISAARLRKTKVLQTSQMPENYTSVIRRLEPSHVVIIDSAEMGGKPGDVAFINPDRVAATRVSTHAMPLSVVMTYIEKELNAKVSLIGIQPARQESSASGFQPVEVMRGVERVVNGFSYALDEKQTR